MTPTLAIPGTQSAPAAKRSVRQNFRWTAAGNAFQAACQWATVSALAKLSNAETVGLYALGIAVTTPIFMLAQLNLRSVLATDVTEAHTFQDYRALRLACMALAMIFTAGFAVFGYSGTEAKIVFLAGLLQCVDLISDVYFGFLQQRERMDRIAISLVLRSATSLVAMSLTMVVTQNLALSLLAAIACRVIVLFFYDARIATEDIVVPAARAQTPGSPWIRQAQLFRTALPLGIVMAAGSLWGNIPRYFITHHLSTYALGIFAALASLTSTGNMVVNALGQAATPRLAKLFAVGDLPGFRRLTLHLCLLGAGLGLAGLAVALTIGPWVVSLLFRPEYAKEQYVLAYLCGAAGIGFVASMLGYVITAARRFREQIPIQIASVAVSAGTAFVMVPRMGLAGAAMALASAPVVQVFGEWLVLHVALKERE